MTFSGSGAATLRDGAGILIAWLGATGPFIPFEGPTNNTQWTVTDDTGPVVFVPSTLASQCAPPSLTVSAGTVNVVIVSSSSASLPSATYTLTNTGGSAVYLPAKAYFPAGTAFFSLNGPTTIGPNGSALLTVAFNAAAKSLAPGRYGASIAFSNAAKLSVVATRQVNLTVVLASFSHDFNADNKSDILWRANTGDIALWFMNGTTLQSGAGVGVIDPNWQIVKTPTGTGDFNADGTADILWHHTNGSVALWLMNGATILSAAGLGAIDTSWQIAGVGDFDGDGRADILWRHSSGAYSIWFMNGATVSSTAGVGAVAATWLVAAITDLNGDGKADIVLRNTSTGDVAVWLMNGATIASGAALGVLPSAWQIVGAGDFNGDGKGDILWRHSSGAMVMWFMNGTVIASSAGVGGVGPAWNVVSTGDYDANGKSDILWRSSGGDVAMWLMNGASIASSAGLGVLPLAWSIVE